MFAETAVARPLLERVIREALGIPAQYIDNEHDVPSAVVRLVANELNDDLGAHRPQGRELNYQREQREVPVRQEENIWPGDLPSPEEVDFSW